MVYAIAVYAKCKFATRAIYARERIKWKYHQISFKVAYNIIPNEGLCNFQELISWIWRI